jgi:CLIP-associating protein 1/2
MLKGDVHQRFPDVFLASLKDGFFQLTLKTVSTTQVTV